MPKFASRSCGEDYECKYPWPEDCGVQCSGDWRRNDHFFEAFPINPNTYIRTKGTTVEEAERKTWEKYQKYLSCPEHEFERRDYKNGVGFCKHCGMFKSKAFEPLTKCVICDTPTDYSRDIENNHYCEVHYDQMPREKWPAWRIRDEEEKEEEPLTKEEVKESLKTVLKSLAKTAKGYSNENK